MKFAYIACTISVSASHKKKAFLHFKDHSFNFVKKNNI